MKIVYEVMATIKMKALDKFVRARKAVKADRAMERGISGHKAAMDALRPTKNEKDKKNGN